MVATSVEHEFTAALERNSQLQSFYFYFFLRFRDRICHMLIMEVQWVVKVTMLTRDCANKVIITSFNERPVLIDLPVEHQNHTMSMALIFFPPLVLARGVSGEAAGGEPDGGRGQSRGLRVRHLQTGETTAGGGGGGWNQASEVTVMVR